MRAISSSWDWRFARNTRRHINLCTDFWMQVTSSVAKIMETYLIVLFTKTQSEAANWGLSSLVSRLSRAKGLSRAQCLLHSSCFPFVWERMLSETSRGCTWRRLELSEDHLQRDVKKKRSEPMGVTVRPTLEHLDDRHSARSLGLQWSCFHLFCDF